MESLSYNIFSGKTFVSANSDIAIYKAIVKKNPTKEFMAIINIIKNIINRKDWVDPAADIKKALGATEKQFEEIINKIAEHFSLSEEEKKTLATKKTPEDMESYVLSKNKK